MSKRLVPFALLVIAALACALPTGSTQPTATPASDSGEIGTAVAGTLTAAAPHDVPLSPTPEAATDTPPAPLVPTDTPIPLTPTLAPPTAQCFAALGDGPTALCINGPDQYQLAQAVEGVNVTRVAISPDGGLVAFLLSRPDLISELWVVNADGTNARRLAGPETLTGSDPANTNWPRTIQWQAGTHNLFFDTGFTPAGGPFGPGEYINSDLWIVNADTGTLSQMLIPGTGGLFSVSPDGAWVAISQPDSIDLISADGATARSGVLTFEMILTYSEYAYKPLVTWAKDGSYFIASIPSHDPLAGDASATLFRAGVDGSVQQLNTLTGTFLFDAFVKPSPDGGWVAYMYTTFDGTNNHTFLNVASTDGAANSGGEMPNGANLHGWSPDSVWVAYSIPGDGLYIANHIGVGQPLAAGVQAVKEVVWTDATTVVFSGSVNDHWGLRQASIGGSFSDVAGPFSNGLVFDVRR